MKKSIAAILAGALCLSALTACGSSTSSSDDSGAANTGDSDKVITVPSFSCVPLLSTIQNI